MVECRNEKKTNSPFQLAYFKKYNSSLCMLGIKGK